MELYGRQDGGPDQEERENVAQPQVDTQVETLNLPQQDRETTKEPRGGLKRGKQGGSPSRQERKRIRL